MRIYLKKRLKALRDRFFGIVEVLLGHQLIMRVIVCILGKILISLGKLALIGLLSYAGITIPELWS